LKTITDGTSDKIEHDVKKGNYITTQLYETAGNNVNVSTGKKGAFQLFSTEIVRNDKPCQSVMNGKVSLREACLFKDLFKSLYPLGYIVSNVEPKSSNQFFVDHSDAWKMLTQDYHRNSHIERRLSTDAPIMLFRDFLVRPHILSLTK
jgi:translation elongation factor P/translation initiation factor 5A